MKKLILSELRLITCYIPALTLLFFALAASSFLFSLNNLITSSGISSETAPVLYVGAAIVLALTLVLFIMAFAQCCHYSYRTYQTYQAHQMSTVARVILLNFIAGVLSSIAIIIFDRCMRGRFRFQADLRSISNLTIEYDLEIVLIFLLGLFVLLRQIFLIFRPNSTDTITEP